MFVFGHYKKILHLVSHETKTKWVYYRTLVILGVLSSDTPKPWLQPERLRVAAVFGLAWALVLAGSSLS